MFIKRYILVYIFLYLLPNFFLCQNRKIADSLIRKLNQETADSAKLKILQDLTNEYFYISFDSVVFYNNQIKEIADRTNNQATLAAYYTNYGIAYIVKEDFPKGLQYCLLALTINEKLNNKNGIQQNCANIGFLYSILNRTDLASKYKTQSLELALEIGDKHAIANCYVSLFQTYLEQGELEKARNTIQKALTIYDELKKGNKNYETEIAVLYSNFGLLYTDLKEKKKATEYFLKAIDIYKNSNQKKLIADTYGHMATNYSVNGDTAKAIEYSKKAIDLAKEIESLDIISTGNFNLYKIYRAKGDSKNALNYYIQYSTAKDSLFTLESEKATLELKEKYESEKKEQQIALHEATIKNNRYTIYIISIIFILVLLLAILIVFRWRLISKRRAVELQQKLLRSQMNPHFIFNALSSIQGSVLEKNTDEAADYISNFATLIRLILDSSTVNSIPLRNETKILSYYLQLQQLRYNNAFDFSINVSDELNTDFVMIPPMLAQPFIENAIEHGIINKCSKGFIDIRFEKDGEFIVFTVDNFCIEKSAATAVRSNMIIEHKPIAVALTKERLYYLNKENIGKINFEFKDFFDDSTTPGVEKTRVSFCIPLCKS